MRWSWAERNAIDAALLCYYAKFLIEAMIFMLDEEKEISLRLNNKAIKKILHQWRDPRWCWLALPSESWTPYLLCEILLMIWNIIWTYELYILKDGLLLLKNIMITLNHYFLGSLPYFYTAPRHLKDKKVFWIFKINLSLFTLYIFWFISDEVRFYL